MTENRDELIKMAEEGEAVKDMVLNSAGWKVISDRIEKKRRDFFDQWSALPVDGDERKALSLKMLDRAFREFMEEIKSVAEEGRQAKETLADLDKREAEKASLEDVPEEIRRLTSPQVTKWPLLKKFLDELPSTFGRREPQVVNKGVGTKSQDPQEVK